MNYPARKHAYRTGWREAIHDLSRDRTSAELKAQRYMLTTTFREPHANESFEDRKRDGYADAVTILTTIADFTGDCGQLLCPFRRLTGEIPAKTTRKGDA